MHTRRDTHPNTLEHIDSINQTKKKEKLFFFQGQKKKRKIFLRYNFIKEDSNRME